MKGRNALKYLGYALSALGFVISLATDWINEEELKQDLKDYVDSKMGEK